MAGALDVFDRFERWLALATRPLYKGVTISSCWCCFPMIVLWLPMTMRR